jgi:hypothetical protein
MIRRYLVDSVINTGKSVVEFVHYIHNIQPSICILVVAGIVQSDSIAKGSPLQELELSSKLTVVAQRKSITNSLGEARPTPVILYSTPLTFFDCAAQVEVEHLMKGSHLAILSVWFGSCYFVLSLLNYLMATQHFYL